MYHRRVYDMLTLWRRRLTFQPCTFSVCGRPSLLVIMPAAKFEDRTIILSSVMAHISFTCYIYQGASMCSWLSEFSLRRCWLAGPSISLLLYFALWLPVPACTLYWPALIIAACLRPSFSKFSLSLSTSRSAVGDCWAHRYLMFIPHRYEMHIIFAITLQNLQPYNCH